MKMRDIPKGLRPREKASLNGVASLTEAELLALVLGSGSRGQNVLQLSQNLLEKNGGLSQLCTSSYAILSSENGISKARALSLLAVFEIARRVAKEEPYANNTSPSEIYEHYKVRLCGLTEEQTTMLVFDRSKRLIREVLLSKGNDGSNWPSENQILKEIIGVNGKTYLLLHNHPSGICLPSDSDLSFNRKMVECMKRTKFKILDHIIVTRSGYYSFRENGLMI